MNKLIVLLSGTLVLGCTSTETENKYELQDLLLTDERYAESPPTVEPEDLKKGPEQVGRVIEYRGHGLGYGAHAQHYRHLHHVHGPACLCHLHPRNRR